MFSDNFGFAAFRSRQQLSAYESMLKKQGIPCKLMNTPIEIGKGCGFSVKFSINDLEMAINASAQQSFPALIGFYSAENINGYLEFKPVTSTMLPDPKQPSTKRIGPS